MKNQVKMDQTIENNTITIEDVLKETPITTNDLQVKSEPGLVNSPTKETNLEVCIPTCQPNQERCTAYLNLTKVESQDDSTPKELPEEPEERFLSEPGVKGSPKDEQSSEDESESDSDEEGSDSDEEESDSDDDSDFNPAKCSPKTNSPKKRTKGKERAKPSAALEEAIKGLMRSNILSSANTNANGDMQQSVPVSQKRDKVKAFAEEINKLPIDDQPQAKEDATALIVDSKKFTRPASLINMDWKVRGLKTHLKHHQLKAAAWMRVRENAEEEPNGGLLCDEMGLGKTLTVLATIAHEKFPGRSKAPTLIIVPRSLVSQWIDQISMHCVKSIGNSLLEHYAGARTGQRDVVKAMEKRLIVITTYEEVCSSHPKLKIPVTIKSQEEHEAWRAQKYNRRAGPLHKVDWHRIVLDEAHVIKNKDCATSLAVRALKGRFKWAISGTPLHNGVEELYPYLHFIFTSQRMEYEAFLRKYSNGLDNILKTVLHRSTYSTRILGKPIVTLPGINNRVVEVELCSAEKFLYREIQDLGTAMISGLADTKQKQKKCILTVILMLRMFVSHPLLSQKVLETVLNQRVIKELRAMAQQNGQDVANSQSEIIINLILAAVDKVTPRPKPPGDFEELRDIYWERIVQIRQKKGTEGEYLRRICPRCKDLVDETKAFVVTSCQHIYCKACFDDLPDQGGKTDTVTRVCSICEKSIEWAGYSDDAPKDSSKKRKKPTPKKKGTTFSKKRAKKSFMKDVLLRDPSDDEWDEPGDNEADWVSEIGDRMPSAKTIAVRDLVANWVKDDEDTKIVIFTQFLKTAQLLEFMCEEQGWKYSLVHHREGISREKQIEQFGKEKDIRIMISSLKTGGIGLNLTMANKCILVDPWWNEAIQDQAYCRLYRIGQPRVVEYVQIVAKGSIDRWMINLQKEKTQNIHQLLNSDSLKDILGLSGEIREESNGGFSILNSKGNKHTHSWAQAIESGILEVVDSSEEY
ncbi:hypothetical protein N7491_009546 [Penicillium cf. griseofulvum]|uniref:Uncharacterized protein n=1 Tax=Penicillium cf. griseofulvum TaxID=2972120 RepID=A0A9W9JP89_9EURO|nr:hypothetical protein N7472_004860 [Penicillium cf. griseofulvum]KAJ5424330.1 hypothetical protein N7491_009546 [Penicillium cf. griseofulvum]